MSNTNDGLVGITQLIAQNTQSITQTIQSVVKNTQLIVELMELTRTSTANQQVILQRLRNLHLQNSPGSLTNKKLTELKESLGKEFQNLDQKFSPKLDDLKQSVDALNQQIQTITQNSGTPSKDS